MEIIKYVRYNEDLMKNLPVEWLSELITFEDVIPDPLSSFLNKNNPTFKKERHRFLNYHMDIVHKMQKNRYKYRKLFKTDLNASLYEDLEFIEKYPKFAPLIDHIEYNNLDKIAKGDWDSVIKTVPFDEYLAKENQFKTHTRKMKKM